MKKLLNAIKSTPKRFAAVFALLLAVAVPAALNAWGPSRPTFTMQNPADYVTFNSITNNDVYKDERDFVRIKERGTGTASFTSNIKLQPGKTYDVMVYYHNNAKSSLNASGKGVAKGAYVRVALPTTAITSSQTAKIGGVIGASNANPAQVWDDVVLSSDTSLTVSYVPGTATIYSAGAINGSKLPDALFSATGTPIGYNKLDGNLPGCTEYSGYITFQVKTPDAPKPDFTLTKHVRAEGTTAWAKSITVNPGTTVEYLLTYKNTGNTTQTNVVIKDSLPKGATYVKGSTTVNGKSVADGVTTSNGINIGNQAAGATVQVIFKAKIASNDDLDVCGDNKLNNTGSAVTSDGTKTDTALVITNKECETEKPVYTCNVLSISKVSRTKHTFSTTYTAKNGATYKSTTYIVKDASGKQVAKETTTGNFTFETSTVGNYTVEAQITVTVNGKDQVAGSDGCKGSFTVSAEDKEMCAIPGKEHLPVGDPDCQLPQTGPLGIFSGIIGLGSVTTAGAYYVVSRRKL